MLPNSKPLILNGPEKGEAYTTTPNCGVPNNFVGYQLPRTGNGYAGIAFRHGHNNNYREYIEIELLDTLENNHRYCLSFYVNIANSCSIATDAINAHLSDTFVLQGSTLSVINLPKTISNPQGNIIQDSLNWVEISGNFIANGGERYLTIGNFDDDSISQSLITNYGNLYYAYYYIDDVSLINCDSLTTINEHDDETISVSPNPATDNLTISSSNPIHLKHAEIFSLDGKRVKYYQPQIGKLNFFELDVSGMETGLYFLRLQTEDGLVTKKVVIGN
jgi:hypothetical protein